MEEMMQVTFQKKIGECSGSRVAKAMECYKRLKAENPKATGYEDIALWVQSVGGPKNNKVFALGSHKVDGVYKIVDFPFIDRSSSSSREKEKDSRVEKLEDTMDVMKDVIQSLKSQIDILTTQQVVVQPSYQHFQTNLSIHIPFGGQPMHATIPSSHPSHVQQTHQGGLDDNVDYMSFTRLLKSNHHGQASIRLTIFGTTSTFAFIGMPSFASAFVGFLYHASGFQSSTVQAPALFPTPMHTPRNMSVN